MRTISAADGALYAAQHTSWCRVEVKDAGGTWRDLTTYPERNLVLGVRWSEDVDSVGLTATVRLQREAEDAVSLSPLHASSPLNTGKVVGGTFAPLIEVGRELRIFVGLGADGEVTTPAPTGQLVFHGFIEEPEFGGDSAELVVTCRGLEAKVQDSFLEDERVYAYATAAGATRGALVFELARAYAVNDLVLPTEKAATGHFYKVTTAGTSSSSAEPTWPSGAGATVTSGTATFTEVGVLAPVTGVALETVLQQLLDDNVGGITLNVPASPSWALKWWKQERSSVLEAMRRLVDQRGWDLRYKYDAASGALKLTLWGPDRTKVVADRVFAPWEVLEVQRVARQLSGIRNAVQVVYSDFGALDPHGQPLRKKILVTDGGSITAYGRRWMEVGEDSSSNIDTAGEATTFATAMLSDLAQPNVEMELKVQLFPWVELGDLYAFDPDNRRWTSQQKLAVVGYESEVNESGGTTTLRVRGKPSTGYERWLGQDGRLRPGDIHQLALLESLGITAGIVIVPVVGGGQLVAPVAAYPAKGAGQGEIEWHVSAATGFTPSSTTMVTAGPQLDTSKLTLLPGETYYARAIPFTRNASRIVRGLPSPEVSFVAGRASASHLDSDVNHTQLPLNGGFEHHLDEANGTIPPDHWRITAGVWGTDLKAVVDANGKSGRRYLQVLSGTTQRTLESDFFDVVAGHRYSLDVPMWRGVSGTDQLLVKIVWYTEAKATEGTSGSVALDATLTSWRRTVDSFTAPATARFAKVVLTKNAPATAASWLVDCVRVECNGEYWHNVGATGEPAFQNFWVNYGAGVFDDASFRRGPDGWVEVRGVIKNGTTIRGTPIFTLPAGYRPRANLLFLEMDGVEALARVDVTANGVVNVQVCANNAALTLSGICFYAW